MSPIEINQEYIENLVNSRIDDLLDKNLSGITWSIDEFRKHCCFNKSAEWVRRYVILPFADEIDFDKGGWCLNPHGGKGKKQMIFAKSAGEWMEENHARIKWSASVPRR